MSLYMQVNELIYGFQNELGLYLSFSNTTAKARLGIAFNSGSVLTNASNGGFRTSFQDSIRDSGICKTFSASSIFSVTRNPNPVQGNSEISTYKNNSETVIVTIQEVNILASTLSKTALFTFNHLLNSSIPFSLGGKGTGEAPSQ